MLFRSDASMCFDYKWDSTTTISPLPGYVSAGNVNPIIATQININIADLNNNIVTALLQRTYASTSASKSILTITDQNNPGVFISYAVTSGTLFGVAVSIGVSYITSSAGFSLSANTVIGLCFAITGDKGDTGPTGPQGIQGIPGPQGIPGSSNLVRPGSSTSVGFNNYMATNQGVVPNNYFLYSSSTGVPTSSLFYSYDNTGTQTEI